MATWTDLCNPVELRSLQLQDSSVPGHTPRPGRLFRLQEIMLKHPAQRSREQHYHRRWWSCGKFGGSSGNERFDLEEALGIHQARCEGRVSRMTEEAGFVRIG